VVAVHLVDSADVELEGLVVHDLRQADRVVGLEVEASTLTASRVLAYRLTGERVTEGIHSADGSRVDLVGSTFANLGGAAARGAALAARRGGFFAATWSIFHGVSRFYAEAGSTGQVSVSVLSPADGFPAPENVTVAGDVVYGDPLFVSEAQGDFHLSRESPAVDAGPEGEACQDEQELEDGPEGCRLDWGYYGGTAGGTESIL